MDGWYQHESLYIRKGKHQQPSTKIVAFDLDSTLIRTKSGKTFPVDRHDWVWLYEHIPTTLAAILDEGYGLVIFSNQLGVGKGKIAIHTLQSKIEDMLEEAGIVDCIVLLATEEDKHRKPALGMYHYYVSTLNHGVVPDLKASVFVGDAAGREKDFSAGDRKFAINAKLRFKTPEEFFLCAESENYTLGMDPQLLANATSEPLRILTKEKEIVLLVGCPASGKSTFAKQYADYAIINQDTLGTRSRCIKAAREALNSSKSVVIDATNGSKKIRAEWIDLAKEQKVPISCIQLQTPETMAKHMNKYREQVNQGKEHKHVPDIAYRVYYKNFEPPTTTEGFSCVVSMPISLHFDTEKEKTLFGLYYS